MIPAETFHSEHDPKRIEKLVLLYNTTVGLSVNSVVWEMVFR
jgi:hypothetical protein